LSDLDIQTLDVVIQKVPASKFVDANFLGALGREMPGIRVAFVSFGVPQPGQQGAKESISHLTIGHYRPDDDTQERLTVDCEDPEILKKVVRAIESFLGGKP
jgi:hypothetical protein